MLALAMTGCGSSSRPLEARARALIAASGAQAVGLYFRPLPTGDSLALDADARIHAASTMKVPVMIQVFRDAEAGRFGLDDSITVRNEFRSMVDGSPYALSEADDSDRSLYERVGGLATIRELVELMITVSSNLAANLLIDLVDARRVTATARALGADSLEVLRGVEDQKAYDAGLSNTTTARDLGVVLAAIAQGRAAGEASCREMEDILARQRFNDRIPAGLPPGTRVAHKTGEITRIHHDAAIVTAANGTRYVLVVLVRGIDDPALAARLTADLAREAHADAVGATGNAR